MKGDGSSGVGFGADPLLARERDDAEKKTEEQAERWARALLPHLIPQAVPAPTPGGWRASDGVLTPPKVPQSPMTGEVNVGGADGANPQDRVVMSVKTAEHGELSLVLDRSNGAVRVVIGVADSRAIAQLASEREALSRQLLGSGLRVESVHVVRQSEVGTVLAPPKVVARLRASVDRGESPEDKEATRRRSSRKLNLIG